MLLDKTRRNHIFQALVQGGLDPSECKVVFSSDGRTANLKHKPSQSELGVSLSSHPEGGVVAEGYARTGDSDGQRFFFGDWGPTVQHIQSWAWQVNHHVNTRDLWAELRSTRAVTGNYLGEVFANTPFTPDEQAAISHELRRISEYVRKTYELSSEQMSRVEARLDEADKASRRVGRKDWLLLFFGTIFTLIITDLIPPEVVQNIFTMVLHSIGHLFGRGGSRSRSITRG